jgi:PKHD-type hydroxylase
MEYIITPHAYDEAWTYWENGFNNKELELLQNLAKNASNNAQVANQVVNNDIRRCKVNWLSNTPEYSWVFHRLAFIVAELNARYYNFDLSGFGEPLQLTHYDNVDKGTYNWHADKGVRTSRKLSVVLQLSDPLEYEGGELQVNNGSELTIPRQRGLIVAFPSYTLHRVTEVTSGTRQSIVAWVSGAPFR